jgi:hypothetical protein
MRSWSACRATPGEPSSSIAPRPQNVTGLLEAPLEAPLLDLLRVLDVERRRRAVLSLSDLDPRRSIPILREALRDPDEEVRLRLRHPERARGPFEPADPRAPRLDLRPRGGR